MKSYTRVLTIAGSDSGGGAGIQADLKTFSALGCYGMSVITAVTAQNTRGVTDVFPISVDSVEKQLDAVLGDIGADAVKIGMLWSADMIGVVARLLRRTKPPHIVLDPVMVAQSGDRLLQEEAVDALLSQLLPIATLFTPNLPEASMLADRPVKTRFEMEQVARGFSESGCPNILIKGGHGEGNDCTDILYTGKDDAIIDVHADRVSTLNNHGTGCTLSSALAAHLARGFSLRDAVFHSKRYITKALEAGACYSIGSGHGPVHHFWDIWKTESVG